MNRKICITTDGTGITDYIKDGVNGFVVKAGDVGALAERMTDVRRRTDELLGMRKAARATYEENFSMKIFGDRLEEELSAAEIAWRMNSDEAHEI